MDKIKDLLKIEYWPYIIILFLIFTSTGALQFVFHHPDEMHYSDAAIQMIEKKDFFTPYNADGTPRFLKPILTYWLVIPSYLIFGINYFSSRVFFWLLGCILIGIVYFMALSLTKNKKVALLSAFISACNPLIMMSATRSIPDILLTVFVTISAWGFMELLSNRYPVKRYFWMAFLGAALAFETKGVPAAAYAGFSVLFLWFNPWNKYSFKRLLNPLPVIVSVVVALSWFVIMYIFYGDDYLHSLYGDQVGHRVTSAWFLFMKNGLLAVINLFLYVMPWSVFLVIGWRKYKRMKSSVEMSVQIEWYIWGFTIFTVLMSAFVFKFYDRYLLPAFPLLSVLIADKLIASQSGTESLIERILRYANIILIVALVIIMVFVGINWQLVLGVALFVMIFILRQSKMFKSVSVYWNIAILMMFLFFNGNILIASLIFPEPAMQLTTNIYELQGNKSPEIYVYEKRNTASKIRIASQNKLDVVTIGNNYELLEGSDHILVIRSSDLDKFDLSNYLVVLGSDQWAKLEVARFPVFFQPYIEKLKESGEKFFIAKPKEGNYVHKF